MSDLGIGGLSPRPQAGPLRCAFCHGELLRAGVHCTRCAALHHRACLLEAPRCATCKTDLGALAEAGLPLGAGLPRRLLGPLGAVSVGGLALAAVVGLLLGARGAVLRWTLPPLEQRMQLSLVDGVRLPVNRLQVAGRLDDAGLGAEVRVGEQAAAWGPDGRFLIDVVDLPEGQSVLRVEVRDRGAAAAREASVLVDSLPPEVTVVEPDEGSSTPSDAIWVRAEVRDATPVQVLIGGHPAALVDGLYARLVPLPRLGAARVEVVAIDELGHQAQVRREVVRRAPRLEVRLDAPEQDAPLGRTLEVQGQVTSELGLDGLRLWVNGASTQVQPDGRFEATLGASGPTWHVEVRARKDDQEAVARRTGRADRTPPALHVGLPRGLVSPHEELEVCGWVDDASEHVEVSAGGRSVRVAPQRAFTLTVPLTRGANRITVVAIDAEGNRSTSAVDVSQSEVGPAWLRDLQPGRRPAGRLPAGLVYGPHAGEFVSVRDGSVLVWVPAPAGGRGLFMGKYEVSELQAQEFARATGREVTWRRTRDPRVPARGMSWEEAGRYVAWAGLRLPTVEEWRRAALGDDGRRFPWGTGPSGPPRSNSAGPGELRVEGRGMGPAPVISFVAGASATGCLHMVGNVAEWLADEVVFQPGLRYHVGGSWTTRVADPLALNTAPAKRGDERVGLRVCLDP